jgi:hypothetical protein
LSAVDHQCFPDVEQASEPDAVAMSTLLRVLLADVESSARRAVCTLLHSLDGVALVGEIGAPADLGAELRRTRADDDLPKLLMRR